MPKDQSYILIVEDEPHIANLLEINLEIDGYRTRVYNEGAPVMQSILNDTPDLILLDVMLPDVNGIDLCKQIKKKHPDIPILVLSALGQTSDRIKGLKSGADDYLAKPFNLEELLLKIKKLRALYRKESTTEHGITSYQIGKVLYYPNSYKLISNNKHLSLSVKESELLLYLIENEGNAVHRNDLIQQIWGNPQEGNPRTIDNYVSNIRKFIEDNPQQPKHLKTIRGIGYMISLT